MARLIQGLTNSYEFLWGTVDCFVYPPHKHDVHLKDDEGNLLEADLEEVYFYKIDKPDGYAYQRVYTDETSPLHKAG